MSNTASLRAALERVRAQIEGEMSDAPSKDYVLTVFDRGARAALAATPEPASERLRPRAWQVPQVRALSPAATPEPEPAMERHVHRFISRGEDGYPPVRCEVCGATPPEPEPAVEHRMGPPRSEAGDAQDEWTNRCIGCGAVWTVNGCPNASPAPEGGAGLDAAIRDYAMELLTPAPEEAGK